MNGYAIVEINGKQYKVTEKAVLTVDFLGDTELKTFECDKVLLKSEGDNLEVGTPYLNDKMVFDVLGSEKLKKIRVAKYHAKSNVRTVTGSRRQVTKLKLQSKNREKKA